MQNDRQNDRQNDKQHMKNQAQQPGSPDHEGNKLVRVIKTIVINPEIGRSVDEQVIKFQYYNSFNYSFLSRDQDSVSMTLGITSPNPGEGKTLVACNLAVSLAMGSRKKTVLVDLNVYNPCLHRVFGTERGPGLAEALRGGNIHVTQTQIDNLCVLTADNFVSVQDGKVASPPFSSFATQPLVHPALSLDQLASFRDTIYSLEQEFEFVIVDMPSLNTQGFPVLYANQLNGLVVVVNTGATKKEEINGIFHQINERQVLGFVFNRFTDGSPS
jgi:Mrp family chromosome partitioning ATPase